MRDLTALAAILAAFVGLPWLILHYVNRWKKIPSLTREDQNLLDETYALTVRLAERVSTVEQIIAIGDRSGGAAVPGPARFALPSAPKPSTLQD
jgi:phage shock protein B